MATEGRVKIGTEVDKSGLEKGLAGLGSFAQKGFSVLSNAAISMGKTIVGAVGVASTAVSALGTAAISGYAKYEQLIGGVETLFGSSFQTVEEYAEGIGASMDFAASTFEKYRDRQNKVLENADNAYKTAGLSANEYMENVTSFAASLNSSLGKYAWQSANYADMAMTDMADNANKMGTNIESIQNAYQGFAKQNYTMLDNLKLGYGGTKEEMERLLRDAEELEGLEIGSLDVSNFADIIDAIHIVQDNLGITGTTAKEASTTIEGSMNSAKAAWSNLVVGIADDTQDFDKLVDNFVESAVTAADNLLPRIETSINGIGTLVEKLLPEILDEIPTVINDVLPDLIQSGVNLVDSFVDGIEQNLPLIMSAGENILSNLVVGVESMLPSLLSIGTQLLQTFYDGVVSGIPVFTNVAEELISNIASGLTSNLPALVEKGNELISSISQSITDNLPGIVQSGAQILTSLVTGFAQMLPNLLNAAVDGIISLALALTDPNTLTGIIEAGIALLTSLVSGIMEALPKLIEAAPTILANLVSAIIANLPRLVIAAVEIMRSLAKGMLNAIAELLKTVPRIYTELSKKFKEINWGDIGRNLIEGIKKGISEKTGALVESVLGAAKDAVSAVKNFLGIASPSKLMRDLIGKNMIAGINVGIEKETPELEKTSTYSAKRAVESMQGQALGRSQKIASDMGKIVGGASGSNPDEVKVVLEKGSITGDVTMDGEKVGTLVAPTVDIEIEKARKESER